MTSVLETISAHHLIFRTGDTIKGTKANTAIVSFRTFVPLQKETFTLQQSISRVRFAPETKPAGACGLLNEQTVGTPGRPAHCIA